MQRRDFMKYGTAALMAPTGIQLLPAELIPNEFSAAPDAISSDPADVSDVTWTARWVWATVTGLEPNTYIYFRRLFTLPSLPNRVVPIRISAWTDYSLHVNGHKLGFGPPISNARRHYFDTYNIGQYLKQGVNVLAVRAYSLATATEDTVKERGGFIFQGQINLRGQTVCLNTGQSWKCLIPETWDRKSPRQSYELHFVEIADFRKDPEGWTTEHFDDSQWQRPLDVEVSKGTRFDFEQMFPRDLGRIDETFQPVASIVRAAEVQRQSGSEIPAIQVQAEQFQPVQTVRMTNLSSLATGDPHAEIQAPEQGRDAALVFDMGGIVLGCPYFEIEGEGGSVVDVSISEYLEDGRVLASRKILPKESTYLTDRITLRGGKTTWQRNDYNGYRYIQLTVRNALKPIVIRKIGTVLRRYNFDQEATFRSSDSTLDRVFEGCKLTHRVNTHWGYCGSAWREHAQWSDLPWAAMNLAVFHNPPVMRHFLRQVALGQNSEGRMQFPSPGNIGTELPEQTMWLGNDLWKCALYFNDVGLVRDLLPVMVKANDWFKKHTTSRGLLSTKDWTRKWLVIDWGYPFVGDPDPGELATLNMIYYDFLCSIAKCAEFVGNAEQQKVFQAQADSIKQSINNAYFDPAQDRYYEKPNYLIPSQYASTLAVNYGVVPEERLQQVFDFAVGSELRPGIASPWFMGNVLEAFARAGRFQDGVGSISRYWSSFFQADTDVLWELWNIPSEEVLPVPGYTSEMYARTITYSSAPASYATNYLLGVLPLKPGFAEALIAPHFAGLHCASGCSPTSKGPVHVRWERRPAKRETVIYISIPQDLRALVRLPFTESEPTVAVNNQPFFSSGQFRENSQIENPQKSADTLQFWAKPGSYYFKSSAV
jgi:hypothetical protein